LIILKFNSFSEARAFFTSHPANCISSGFGVGLITTAPGTIGTLLAFPVYKMLLLLVYPEKILFAIFVMFLIGIWASAKTGEFLGEHDSSVIVWDEVVAFCIVLFFTPNHLFWALLAFLIFRFFDIFKPYPIDLIDAKLANGLGVMLDDIVAAFYTLLCLALVKLLV
tara:strand:+ start:390 stop:890 length:501 start_codon:yes stop_codon:yes gene_type:complete